MIPVRKPEQVTTHRRPSALLVASSETGVMLAARGELSVGIVVTETSSAANRVVSRQGLTIKPGS